MIKEFKTNRSATKLRNDHQKSKLNMNCKREDKLMLDSGEKSQDAYGNVSFGRALDKVKQSLPSSQRRQRCVIRRLDVSFGLIVQDEKQSRRRPSNLSLHSHTIFLKHWQVRRKPLVRMKIL